MSVLPNDRYEKTIAAAGQTVFNYDWDVPSAYPGQVKVIQYVLATQTKTTLTYWCRLHCRCRKQACYIDKRCGCR